MAKVNVVTIAAYR